MLLELVDELVNLPLGYFGLVSEHVFAADVLLWLSQGRRAVFDEHGHDMANDGLAIGKVGIRGIGSGNCWGVHGGEAAQLTLAAPPYYFTHSGKLECDCTGQLPRLCL